MVSFRSIEELRKERPLLATSPWTVQEMWTTLLERIVTLEKDAKKKNHNVQELANELFDEQENQAHTIGTL